MIASAEVYRTPSLSPVGLYPLVLPVPNVASSLAKKGFNPEEAHLLNTLSDKKKKEHYLSKNLETTINHVFEDSAVSFTNYYQLKNDEVISYPDGTILNIDPDERGGLNKFGIESAVAGALQNPNQIVLLYSPPGPVVFDDNPRNKFREVKPYTDGQLYMMFSDGEKVNNVAISVSQSGESWISQLMPSIYKQALSRLTDIERVSYFIQNPLLTGMSIDDFLNQQWTNDNRVIYKNKDNIQYSLSATLQLIRQSIAGLLPKSSIVADIMQSINFDNFTEHDIDRIYGALAQQYMRDKGLDTLTLGGSCGGDVIKRDIFSSGMDNLSTDFRMITQGKNLPGFIKPEDEKEKITFELKPGHTCQKCGADGGKSKLGNCDICTGCQEKYDSGEFK
ncbi:MAG: hypothetical protein NTZ55_03600 [Candidatus Roizmanbacteria bacterium]|nr:hypothetical protein [Candidatus Roizmanbacteria bacterium]